MGRDGSGSFVGRRVVRPRGLASFLLAGLLETIPVSSMTASPVPKSVDPSLAPAMTAIEVRGPGDPLWRRWVDLDADGKLDLVVVSGSASTPPAPDENRMEALLSYLKVTPAFLDRRRILLYRHTELALVPWGDPLPLPGDASAVDIADLDRDGRPEILFVAGNRVSAFSRRDGGEGYASEPRTLVDVESFLGYTRTFIPGARITAEAAKDRSAQLVLSTPRGVEVRGVGAPEHEADAGRDTAFPDEGVRGTDRPGPANDKDRAPWAVRPPVLLRSGFRSLDFGDTELVLAERPLRVVDVDGDGEADVLFTGVADITVFRGLRGGRFETSPLRKNFPAETAAGRLISIAVEDVDGDGPLDIVLTRVPWEAGEGEDVSDDEKPSGNSKEQPEDPAPAEGADNRPADTGKTLSRIEIYRGRPGLDFPRTPDVSVDVPRTRKRESAFVTLQKIDGDAKSDLVITRFWASAWQIARVMVTKKASVRISFESRLQGADGKFAPPRGKPYETTFLVDLRRGLSGLPSQPRGDFNGDGRTDLLEFTDTPAACVHITTPEGSFPGKPAWSVALPRAPEDRALTDVEDLDGDGRSDVAFFSPDAAGFVITLVRSKR